MAADTKKNKSPGKMNYGSYIDKSGNTAKFELWYPEDLIVIYTEYEKAMQAGCTPARFIEGFMLCAGYSPFYEWQKEYINEILDFNKKEVRYGVVGIANCRKTHTNALIILFLLILSPKSKPTEIRLTSPTQNSSDYVTVKEMRSIARTLKIENCFDFDNPFSICIKGDRDRQYGYLKNFCIPMDSARCDSIRGFHSRGTAAMFFDDAIHFPDYVWEACSGNMSLTDGDRVIWCANANASRDMGFFVDRIFGHKTLWKSRRVTIDDITEEKVKERIIKNVTDTFGEGTPLYRAMLYCEFPKDMTGTLFCYESLLMADRRWEERKNMEPENTYQKPVMGVDVAGGIGGASSAVCIRNNSMVILWNTYEESVYDFGNTCMKLAEEYNVSNVVVDACGMGYPLYEILSRNKNFKTVKYMSQNKAGDRAFNCTRSECFWRAADWFQTSLPAVHTTAILRSLLVRIKHYTNEKGQICITSKDDLKKLVGAEAHSLDLADAFMQTFSHEVNWNFGIGYHNGINNELKAVRRPSAFTKGLGDFLYRW